MDLSIIIPVFNVEKYIRACLESVYRQGLDESRFEVIIVNDGTPDKSMEVIQDIIEQHKNITVINQENQGLSTARNNGIAAAKGEYILMPDSDDLLIENSLKPLLEKAIESQADMVVADFIKMNDEDIENYNVQPHRLESDSTFIEKTGKQLFMEDLDPLQSFVWRTLYRKEFLTHFNLKFFPKILYQDRPFTQECYLKARNCIKTSQLFYIYRIGHASAASFALTEKKALDYCISIVKMWELGEKLNLSQKIRLKLQDNVSRCCSMLMTRVSHEINDFSARNRIVDFFNQISPQININNNRKQRIYFFMLRKMPHTFINIRYIYAKIYEEKIRPYFIHLFIS